MFETIPGNDAVPLILLAEHAGHELPEEVHNLGLAPDVFEKDPSLFYDPFAGAVTRELAGSLGATAFCGKFSRLLVDLNRREEDKDVITPRYHGRLIPANQEVTPQEREQRLEAYHRPFRRAVFAEVEKRLAAGQRPFVFCVHSFPLTHSLNAFPDLPRHEEVDLALEFIHETPLLQALRDELGATGLEVRENYPFDLKKLVTGTVVEIEERTGLAVAGLEMRIKSMQNPEKKAKTLASLHAALAKALSTQG